MSDDRRRYNITLRQTVGRLYDGPPVYATYGCDSLIEVARLILVTYRHYWKNWRRTGNPYTL